jgi:hypothetical protein
VRTTTFIHREAMEQTDLAIAAKQRGDDGVAFVHFHRAYELEAEAANTFASKFDDEPTRSILYRSAATLALDCKLIAEAEKLICTALSGNPPEEIAEELRDLLEQVYFHRHLSLRGIELRADEVQMSIAGREIGFGIAPMESFLKRISNTETLLYRTAERKRKRPYREGGRRDREITENLQLFITVPRAASFAVTFRIGASDQLSLPGLATGSTGEEIVDEVLDCLELYKRGDERELRERINEDAYYRNFISLARNIEPDGRKVGLVGFTSVRAGRTKEVSLTRATTDTPSLKPTDVTTGKNTPSADEDTVEITGFLRFANSLKKTDEIQIVTSSNIRHVVVVPPGMMSDIVKPLWDSEVAITGVQKGRRIFLMRIRAVDPS